MRREGPTGDRKVCDRLRGEESWRVGGLRGLALLGTLVGVLGMTPDAVPLGANGHRIVARIAQNHLSDRARTRALALLDGDDLARIASWADDYRGTPAGRRTATWHYTTLPTGQSYTYTPDDGNTDIGEAIRDQKAVLSDVARPRAERVQALKFLTHFLGDVHQPMHVGRDGDRGGNDIHVQWFGGQTNLHRVWDSAILDHHELSYMEWVAFLDRVAPEEVSRWQADPIEVWIAESQELREIAYAAMASDEGSGDVPSLSWNYRNDMTPHLERRLVRAGIRLAGILNSALGS